MLYQYLQVQTDVPQVSCIPLYEISQMDHQNLAVEI